MHMVVFVKPDQKPAAQQPAGIGTRMSKAITKATGKQPCGPCRQSRDGIDRAERIVKKLL